MNTFQRLWPYIKTQKKKLILCGLMALLVSCFWGLNLSAAFPLVKVMLQGESMDEYVGRQIRQREETIELEKAEMALREQEYARDDPELLQKQARSQDQISEATHSLVALNWVKQYVVSWLPRDAFDMLALILVAALFGTLLKGAFIYLQDVMARSMVESTIIQVRKDAFQHVLSLDYQSISNRGTPELLSRFTNDVTQISQGLSLLGGKLLREPLKAFICIALAFWVNWQLTLLSFLFVPITGSFFYSVGKKLKRASHKQMESVSRVYKTLDETLSGLKVVHAFNAEERHQKQFDRDNEEYYGRAMRIAKIDSLTSPVTELLGILAAFVALLPGAYLVLRGTREIWGITLSSGQMDVAQLTLLYVLLIGTLDPIRKLSSVYAPLKRSTAAADRVFALMDEHGLVQKMDNPKTLQRHADCIEFQNLSFTYASRDPGQAQRPPALSNLNLKVAAGEVVAVVGENGCGKSTLLNMLPRFFDPDSGQILIDDIPIQEVCVKNLRDQIGLVSQETLLFDTTIYENIRYGNPEASASEIEAAADQAFVTKFLDQFPEGFETVVGEKGMRLSGGQRQRVALARAILRDPAILILDEATSAIDSQSEYLIHQTLKTFVKGRTTFIITHTMSQSMLELVSRIVVMDSGKIIATGEHNTLMESCPTYQRLFHARTKQKSA